jgi:hypothetical protein
MNIRKHIAVATLAVSFVYPLHAKAGTVIDKATGRGIPGAVVVATWEGSIAAYVESRSVCYKFEVAQTDERGHFGISAVTEDLNPLLSNRRREIVVLARGYQMSPTYDSESEEVPMEPMRGTPSEKFKALPRTRAGGCEGDEKALLPYLKALHQAMIELATTQQEKLEAADLRYQIDLLEVGKQEARRRDQVRRQDLLRSDK